MLCKDTKYFLNLKGFVQNFFEEPPSDSPKEGREKD